MKIKLTSIYSIGILSLALALFSSNFAQGIAATANTATTSEEHKISNTDRASQTSTLSVTPTTSAQTEPSTTSTNVKSVSSSADGQTVSVDNSSETSANNAIANFRKAANDTTRITNLKTAGDKLIQARLNTLNKLITTISNANIDSSIKTDLTSQVQGQISQLTTLQSTIASETNLANLKNDIKSIFPNHYIYVLFIPVIHSQVAATRINKAIATLTSLEPQIESFLSQLKTEKTDTTSGDAAYADYKTQLATATNATSSAIASFKSVDLSNETSGKSALSAGRTSLTNAKNALEKVKSDLQTIANLSK